MSNAEVRDAAESAWRRAQEAVIDGSANGRGIFVGLSTFLAVIKLAQLGDGQIQFVETDIAIEGGVLQLISWQRDGQYQIFRTVGALRIIRRHPLTLYLQVELPDS